MNQYELSAVMFAVINFVGIIVLWCLLDYKISKEKLKQKKSQIDDIQTSLNAIGIMVNGIHNDSKDVKHYINGICEKLYEEDEE